MESNEVKLDIDIDSLGKIAIYLEGIKQGKGGNILPLVDYDIEQLWDAMEYLRKDMLLECREEQLKQKIK